MDHNKTPKATLESVLMYFGILFDGLVLPKALVDVRISNDWALSVQSCLGMTELTPDALNIFLSYLGSQFDADHSGRMPILKGEGER